MSSRFYPLYQLGNPQLRIFLPNFWMKLVKPVEKLPPNVVQFEVPLAMTEYDVRNYLEKIYNVEVMHVSCEQTDGKCVKSHRGYIIKEDDYTRAIVTLPRGTEFTFPDMDSEEDKTDEEKKRKKSVESMNKSFSTFARSRKHRFGLPPWFTC